MRQKKNWSYCLYWRNVWVISGQGKTVKAHVCSQTMNHNCQVEHLRTYKWLQLHQKTSWSQRWWHLGESFCEKEVIFSRLQHHFTCLLFADAHSWGSLSQWDTGVSQESLYFQRNWVAIASHHDCASISELLLTTSWVQNGRSQEGLNWKPVMMSLNRCS